MLLGWAVWTGEYDLDDGWKHVLFCWPIAFVRMDRSVFCFNQGIPPFQARPFLSFINGDVVVIGGFGRPKSRTSKGPYQYTSAKTWNMEAAVGRMACVRWRHSWWMCTAWPASIWTSWIRRVRFLASCESIKGEGNSPVSLGLMYLTVRIPIDGHAPHAVLLLIWGFHKMGHPQNSWFLMENSMNMDDLGLPPFMETPIFWKSVCSFSSSHFQPGMTRSVTIWSRCTNEDGSMAICSPKTCSSMIRSWDSTSGGWIYIYITIYIYLRYQIF